MLAQEVAGNHGVALWGRTEAGFATDPVMVELSLIFVSTRIQVQMDVYPRWCVWPGLQCVTCCTWTVITVRLGSKSPESCRSRSDDRPVRRRGDEIEIETWFQEEGRLAACRNWLIRDTATGQQLGRGTRHVLSFCTKS